MQENIKVFLRIKPNVENLSELKNEDCAIYKVNNNQLHLFEKKKNYNDMNEVKTKIFNFNHIFNVDTKQNDIFDSLGKSLINNFISKYPYGYNSSILAYGNTNSGKTYTIYGDGSNSENKENNGLIFFCMNYFFDLKNISKNAEISVSIIEIYLEKIRDLGKIFQLSQLSTTTDDIIKYYSQFHDNIIREDEKGNTYVENITMLPIKNIDDVTDIINLCFKYRKTHATKKNLVSSRSHCLLTVYQHREKQLISQINFIDLAGSEKFNDIEMVNKKELININNTLSVLNRVIIALSTKNRIIQNMEKKKENEILKNEAICSASVHVPYRDSKLTRLLKNSLNGNSFTYILICLNLNSYKIDDFINSLIFAKRCKKIKQRIKKISRSKHSSKSENCRNDSSDDNNTYESFDSNTENFQFLLDENKGDDPQFFEKHLIHNKKRNVLKTLNHTYNTVINKLLVLFTHAIRKKFSDIVKEKRSIINNLIKIIKSEENNKEELKRYKNYLTKILKKKKKDLINNEIYLNDLIHSKRNETETGIQNYYPHQLCTNKSLSICQIKDHTLNDLSRLPIDLCQKQDYSSTSNKIEEDEFTRTIENNTLKQYPEMSALVDNAPSQKNISRGISQDISSNFISSKILEKNELKDDPFLLPMYKTISIYDKQTKDEHDIKHVYLDIDEIYKIELNQLNEKIKIMIEINLLAISLFTNVEKLAKILKNVYKKKYNVILMNGKKTLNIPNYNYKEFKKVYDFNHLQLEQSSQMDSPCLLIKDMDKNIVSLYQKINERQTLHKSKKG
ncbi:kinesin-like protein, putative [Plasmodium malariae]|uniref:Kinesin-like protein n=1 Tax=Plasmodium malariae TaxID=5858 RepID=A0A1C3KD84_PLAMA|nr:kinesin-like protein, putative [Plasmodium malariae]